MEVTAEKRELEFAAHKESEDRERVAVDLKAGLHPLKEWQRPHAHNSKCQSGQEEFRIAETSRSMFT